MKIIIKIALVLILTLSFSQISKAESSQIGVGKPSKPSSTCVANILRCKDGYVATVLGKNALGCPVSACMAACKKNLQVPKCRDGKQPQVIGMDQENCPIVQCDKVCTKVFQEPACKPGTVAEKVGFDKENCPIVKCVSKK